MTTADSESRRAESSGLVWNRALPWAATALLLLLAAGALAWTVAGWQAERRLVRVTETLESQGLTTDPRDLQGPRPGPEELRAGHALEAMVHLLASVDDGNEAAGRLDLPLDTAADPEQLKLAVTWLEHPARRAALDTLDRHAHVRRAAADVSSAPWSEVGELVSALRLRRLLRTRALVSVAEGRPDDAFAAASDLLLLADWIQGYDPSLLSWLIGTAVGESGLSALEQLMQRISPSAEIRAELTERLDRLLARPPSFGLEADLARSRRLLAQTDADTRLAEGLSSPRSVLGRALGSWTEARYHARWLEAYGELALRSRTEAHRRPPMDDYLADDSPYSIPVRFLVPNLVDSLHKTDRLRMGCELARLALAWEARRERQGSPPSAPADLVPESLESLPVDVFSGESLVWKPGETGGLLYSVGADGRDDGGKNAGTPEEGDADDLAWRLPGKRPAPPAGSVEGIAAR